MTAKFDITVTSGILKVRITGDPTADEIIQVLKGISDESGFIHRLRLWDFRKARFNLNNEDIKKVARQAKAAEKKPGKVAMLTSEDLSFGLARMYEAYRSSPIVSLQVFRDESKAVDWLLAGETQPTEEKSE